MNVTKEKGGDGGIGESIATAGTALVLSDGIIMGSWMDSAG